MSSPALPAKHRTAGAAAGPARRRAVPGTLPHRNLPLLLLRSREAVLARFRPLLQAHGLTEQQWRIVRALHELGDLEPRQIVEACCISSPSLAGVLQRMDQLGLVARTRHDSDQRRLIVSLTPRSRALVARMAPLIEARYRELEAALGDSSVRRLYRQLDALLEALAAAGDDTGHEIDGEAA